MVEEISQIAIIFKRIREDEYSTIEEFVPYKAVEGYYYEEESCFIDSEQNVYVHIASMAEIGNCYGGRVSLFEMFRANPNRNIREIRQMLLDIANRYVYYRNTDEDSEEYNIVKTKDKVTGEVAVFNDKDTEIFYATYRELTPIEPAKPATNLVSKKTTPTKDKKTEEKNFETPLELIEAVKKTVKGQDEAIKTIVTTIWIRYKYPEIPKTNILIVGPTGVGKTAIFRKLKKLLGVAVTNYGVTGTSQAGFKGHDIEEMLAQLYYEAESDVEKTENGIIIIDEFDKIGKKGELGDISTVAVQNELLKLVEGCEREVELGPINRVNLDTTGITFVCCGAFSDIFEEDTSKLAGFGNRKEQKVNDNIVVTPAMIMKEGIISELMGRLPVIIKLNDISDKPDVLKDILLNSDESILEGLVKTIENKGIEVEGVDNLVDSIVEEAIAKKSGARGLFGPTKKIFYEVLYDIDNNPGKYSKVIFNNTIAPEQPRYELVPKKVKKRTKKQELMVKESE